MSGPINNLNAHYHVENYGEGHAVVDVHLEGEGHHDRHCSLSVTYNDKLVREHFNIPENAPATETVARIMQEVKPEEILSLTESQWDQISNPMMTIRIAQRFTETKEASVMQSVIQQRKSDLKDTPIPLIRQAQLNYIDELQKNILELEESFKGLTLDKRNEGSEKFVKLRKQLAKAVFQDVVRNRVESLMKASGDNRPVDDVLCIYGFNRLFTRDRASAGTDIDFMLVMDTTNKDLIADIRQLIKTEVKPEMERVGIDMETADYLIIDLPTYKDKLDNIRSALFTLANMFNPMKERDNVALITGSEAMLRDNIFKLSDTQLASHFSELLAKSKAISVEEKEGLKKVVIDRLASDGDNFRSGLIDHLQKIACSELYIGKEPYNKKQTIQTIMANPQLLAQRESRDAVFSTKFCINRMVDLIRSSTIEPELSVKQINDLETLGLFLCNTVCYLEAKEEAPVTVLESYSDITYGQMKSMAIQDRIVAAYLLSSFGFQIDALAEDFPERFYESLWKLGDSLNDQAKRTEEKIYNSAKDYVYSH